MPLLPAPVVSPLNPVQRPVVPQQTFHAEREVQHLPPLHQLHEEVCVHAGPQIVEQVGRERERDGSDSEQQQAEVPDPDVDRSLRCGAPSFARQQSECGTSLSFPNVSLHCHYEVKRHEQKHNRKRQKVIDALQICSVGRVGLKLSLCDLRLRKNHPQGGVEQHTRARKYEHREK